MKKLLRDRAFVKSFTVGIAFVIAIVAMRRSGGRDWIFALCDGFFVTGVLLLGASGLQFCKVQGSFDIFSYGIPHLYATCFPGLSTMSDEHRAEKFADYRMRVEKNRKFKFGTLISGCFYMAVAICFFIAYLSTT